MTNWTVSWFTCHPRPVINGRLSTVVHSSSDGLIFVPIRLGGVRIGRGSAAFTSHFLEVITTIIRIILFTTSRDLGEITSLAAVPNSHPIKTTLVSCSTFAKWNHLIYFQGLKITHRYDDGLWKRAWIRPNWEAQQTRPAKNAIKCMAFPANMSLGEVLQWDAIRKRRPIFTPPI